MGGGVSKPDKSYGVPSKVLVLQTLKNLPFMQIMDDKTVEELALCFQVVRYAKGATIKTESGQFYIVAEGAVDMSSIIPTPNRKQHVTEVLCQRKVGDYISYTAREDLIVRVMKDFDVCSRTDTISKLARKKLAQVLELNHSTADAFTGCTLLKLHNPRFQNLRSKYAVRKVDIKNTARYSGGRGVRMASVLTRPEKMHLFSSIVESDVVNCLLDIPFFEVVENSRLLALSNMCSYTFVKRGEKLYRAGESGDRFFICIHGALEASIKVTVNSGRSAFVVPAAAPDEPTFVTTLQPPAKSAKATKKLTAGAYFGETSLLLKIPRVWTVTAVEDTLLVYIDRTSFCNFLKVVPDAAAVLMEHVRFNFLDTLIKQGCAMLNAIPPIKLQQLSFISEVVEVEASSQIIAHREKHTPFFILVRGEVELIYHGNAASKPDEKVLVCPGGYFGQEAIILSAPSMVTARATTSCLLLKLTVDAFLDFFADLPEVFAEFCIKCLRDRVRPEHVLHHYEASKLWSADCVGRRRHNEVALFEHIEDYNWEADVSDDSMHERALVIYLKFLADAAPQSVVLPMDTLTSVEAEIEASTVGRDTFAAVRSELLMSMDDDAFAAFKQSPTFTEFLASLYCPQQIFDALTPERESLLNMGLHRERGVLAIEDLVDENDFAPTPKPAFGTFSSKSQRRSIVSATVVGGAPVPLNAQGTQTSLMRPHPQLAEMLDQRSRRKVRSEKSRRMLSTSFVC